MNYIKCSEKGPKWLSIGFSNMETKPENINRDWFHWSFFTKCWCTWILSLTPVHQGGPQNTSVNPLSYVLIVVSQLQSQKWGYLKGFNINIMNSFFENKQ